MAKQFNPFHSWLGIEERLGVPTHFQLLGVKPKVDDRAAFQQQVETQFKAVVAKLDGMSESEIGSHQKLHTRVRSHVVKARQILLDDKLRAAYIQGLRDKVRDKKAAANSASSKSAESAKSAKSTTPANAAAAEKPKAKSAVRKPAATTQQFPSVERTQKPSDERTTPETVPTEKPELRQLAATTQEIPLVAQTQKPISERTTPKTVPTEKPELRQPAATIQQIPSVEKTNNESSERTRPKTNSAKKSETRQPAATIQQIPPLEKTKEPVGARSTNQTVPMAIPVAKPIAKPVATNAAAQVATPIAQPAKAASRDLPEPPPTPRDFYGAVNQQREKASVAKTSAADINAQIDKLQNEARTEAIHVRTVRKRRKRSFAIPILLGSFLLLGIAGFSMLFSGDAKLDLSALAGSGDSNATENTTSEIASDDPPTSAPAATDAGEVADPEDVSGSDNREAELANNKRDREIAPEAWDGGSDEPDSPSEPPEMPDTPDKSDLAMGTEPKIDANADANLESSTNPLRPSESELAMKSEPVDSEPMDPQPTTAEPIELEPVESEPIVLESPTEEPLDGEPVVIDTEPAPEMELASKEPTLPDAADTSIGDEPTSAQEAKPEMEVASTEPTLPDAVGATGEEVTPAEEVAPAEEAKDPEFFADQVTKFESAEFLLTRARDEMKRGRTNSAGEQFVLAEKVLSEALGKTNPTIEQQIADGRAALTELDGFWNQVISSARNFSGDSLEPAPGVQIGLIEARADDVVLKIGGEQVMIPYRSLRPGLAMELASKTAASDPAQWMLQQATFRIIHSSGSAKSSEAIETLLSEGDAAGLSTESLRRFWKSNLNGDDAAPIQKQQYLPKKLKPLVAQLVGRRYSNVRRVDPQTAGSLATELSSAEYTDPMMRVAALDESIKLATRAGKASLMVDLIDELGKSVQIDAAEMKLEGFQAMSRRLPENADPREIAGTFYEFTRSEDADAANSIGLQKLKRSMLEFAMQNEMIDLKRLISQSMDQ